MTDRRILDNQQLIISGVGGQGILFITRLLAEAAIARKLPALSSETHGMAQRGGIVVSHLKVGEFSSPLVRSGHADGMLVMRGDNFPLHVSFLGTGGWAALNTGTMEPEANGLVVHAVDADRLACECGAPQTVNLVLLGFVLAENSPFPFFCSADDIRTV
ncbi:MAG TPA: 2-oxoacid:acceptor oxidoreductase family protein, partial [Geobacteraceae bacterium]|nr:2-oxoacid:acceptor oxidoreductase family protein [Geobacteraceae bacterium]